MSRCAPSVADMEATEATAPATGEDTGGVTGGWAEIAPHSFYRSFPGFGQHWLPPLGPFTEHAFRDFGGLNLGLALAAMVAATTLTTHTARCAAAAWLGYSVPHLAFHAAHTAPFSAGDDVAQLLSLAALVAIPAAAWWLTSHAQVGRRVR